MIAPHPPAPRAVAISTIEHRVREPARYRAEAVGARLIRISVWPRAGSAAQPATYDVRLAWRDGRWRVTSIAGGPRVCRQTIGGARDPDPSPTTMLSC